MELRMLWKTARRRWWLIALPALAALAYAAYGVMTAPGGSSFGTSVSFTAAAPPQGDETSYEDGEYYPWLSSEYVVNALTDWVRTSTFAEEVSAELASQGLDIPPGALRPAIAADNERSVMVLYLNWGDPEQLQAIAEAAAVVLQTRSVAYFPQFGAGNVEVVPLDSPSIGPVPPSLSSRLEPLVRVALGLAAGVALAFLIDYLDPTLHERAEVESLGLPVLAEIPPERKRLFG
jgi:capsular polysaccharide biosynthesis protein